MSKATQILHSIPIDELTGSISVPVYQTSTFVQEVPGVNKGYDYTRSNNPTRKALEDIVAQLEGGHSAYAFATGIAVIDAIAKLLSVGDEIVAVDDIYGGAYRLFTQIYQKLGIKIHFVDTTDADNILEYINDKTKLVWIESPTNPTLKISDIKRISAIAHSFNALVVVDNTFASPIAQNPIALGADLVFHSGTKYIAGHSDLVAGLVIAKTEELSQQIKYIQNATGGVLAPWDCFLTIRGIETLDLRYRKISENALDIAAYLTTLPEIDKVYYPGLKNHKNHEIAAQQQNNLFGGIIAFTLKEDTVEAAVKVVTTTKLFKLAESLLCHPAQMTHASVPREKRLSSGVQDSLIRLSVGIEDSEDLKKDIAQAIAQLQFAHV